MVSILVFAAIEFWVGLRSHSLTLGADAGHMLSDGISLGIALGAASLAKRSIRLNSGSQLELLAALVNGLGLLAMALWIGREAWIHWQGPPVEVLSLPMMVTAALGLLINGFNLYWLRGHSPENLNVQGIMLHVLADTLGSVGAILASVAVLCWQWMWADTVIGCVVALAVSGSALVLIGQCLKQLRAQSPREALLPQDLAALGWFEAGKTDLSRQILE